MSGWKVLDVLGLALVSAIFAAFTYLMGRSVFEDGLAISSGSGYLVTAYAVALAHVVLALGMLTLGSLGAMIYRVAR